MIQGLVREVKDWFTEPGAAEGLSSHIRGFGILGRPRHVLSLPSAPMYTFLLLLDGRGRLCYIACC